MKTRKTIKQMSNFSKTSSNPSKELQIRTILKIKFKDCFMRLLQIVKKKLPMIH